MKYYRNFFNLRLILQLHIAEPPYFPVTWISYFYIFWSKQFITYPAIKIWFKTCFIFYRHDKIFIKMIFHDYLAIIILFKNCFNKFIGCIFSSVKNNWLAKSIINTYNFVSKIAKNVFMIYFSTRSILLSSLLWTTY